MHWMLLPYKRYADFEGRSQRKEYWLFYLFTILVNMGIGSIFGRPQIYGQTPAWTLFGSALSGMFALFNLVPALAVATRRLHDTDRSGWWIGLFFPLVIGSIVLTRAFHSAWWLLPPVATLIALLVFLCRDSTPGPNRFGEDPKGRGDYDVFN